MQVFNIRVPVTICASEKSRSFPDLFPEIIRLQDYRILPIPHGPVNNVLLAALYMNSDAVYLRVRRIDLYLGSESIDNVT